MIWKCLYRRYVLFKVWGLKITAIAMHTNCCTIIGDTSQRSRVNYRHSNNNKQNNIKQLQTICYINQSKFIIMATKVRHNTSKTGRKSAEMSRKWSDKDVTNSSAAISHPLKQFQVLKQCHNDSNTWIRLAIAYISICRWNYVGWGA